MIYNERKMTVIEDYLNGIRMVSKEEEKKILADNGYKNTGIFAEKYVAKLLESNEIVFKKNLRISTAHCSVIPDFYLYELDVILEIKSRSYNCPGTASEKIDNIPRKYSKIHDCETCKNTKIIVVFAGYEILNPSSQELVNPLREYVVDFVSLAKKYNVTDWINLPNLLDTLKKFKKVQTHTDDSTSINGKLKPFVKWIGGKSKISKKITHHFPSQFGKYFEPFVGGAAIAFKLPESIPKSFSDVNARLVNCYDVIKNDVESPITEMTSCEDYYANSLEQYITVRDSFNEGNSSKLKLAAQFIYLNKCCFNGMYRENKSGKFNVPFGKMKNPLICDRVLLRSVSKFLQNVDISCGNYDCINPKSGDLVYLDPPYFQTFSDYSSDGFSKECHTQLKNFVDQLTSIGVLVVLSNSSTEFIKELYCDYTQIPIETRYSVSGKESGRKSVEELLIKNF
jgi:DNA adenine methylase